MSSSGPSDRELRNRSRDRRDGVSRTAENLGDVGDGIDESIELAGEARDYDAKLTGLLGAVLDQDVDTFDYAGEALGNYKDALGDHVASLTGLHDKVDRNRRETLALFGAAAAGYDWINASSKDGSGTGPVSMGDADIDGFGHLGNQGTAAAPQEPVVGVVNNDLLETAWEEMGNQKYGLFSQDAYESFIDGEGSDLAAMEVKFKPGESEYRLYHIDTGEVSGDGWQDAESVQELLENHGSAMQQPSDWTYLDNDNIAEYLTDLSRSEKPGELDFDQYLED